MDALAAAYVAWGTVDWLPVSSNLLGLFSWGGGAPRGGARKLARGETIGTLPAVGWAGRRSCAGVENVQRSTLNV